MFRRATICISSFEDAKSFLQYALRGCPSLIPLHKLIDGVEVHQEHDASRPFCHLFHILKSRFGLQLSQLRISGPLPSKSRALDAPHWNLPPSMITSPSLFPYSTVRLEDVQWPSFAQVAKYIGNFAHASVNTMYLSGLTWDLGEQEHRARFHRRPLSKFRHGKLEIFATKCTDNLRLCSWIASTHSQSLMGTLTDDERHWILMLWSTWPPEYIVPTDPQNVRSLAISRCSFTSSKHS